MPFKQIFDKQEDAPEWARPHLSEADGKFVFEGETVVEIGTLKSTLKKERETRTAKENELKKFGKFKPLIDAFIDSDDEEITQVLDIWNKRNDSHKNNPDVQKMLEQRDKEHARELKKRDDEIATLESEGEKTNYALREYRLWTPLREVAIKAGLSPESWELARLDLANQKKFDFDDDGKIVVMEDGVASTVTPEKYFKEGYSAERPIFYKASTAGGSGATKTDGSGKIGIDLSKLTATERMKYAREHNIKQ
jgi:hypothetical protein